uniref:Uncharacterized protein n=1 Tax=Rhizochromulina marina TaxID=1034831 RepID=A0A7S2SRT6_9STRA|mmetsp:Transcript_449/g.1483  ORF Transcript_449/g.1483 Transcript_449/m.1483 type:complete len:191 (+) Transcript_449:99-671(+)|eukprot:CAMPEP_0118980744 /NCGR_PEP_ID=MMETSP1173-20130426/29019_1 /TAXON_ID=1034831 /ORGANISM="Rhizochromulina marina cf, Strain CCMP1243" /LENGTH=190 /DNA_ID=CAMNT_0006931113 /DNA_START=64 /DNA_END=636 /DNA_ORIENTATION=-
MENWDEFVVKFTKVSRALHRSLESEAELLEQSRELKTSLVEKTIQLQAAFATIQQDEVTIKQLRREAKKAISRAEMLAAKDKTAQQLIQDLQKEVENLRVQVSSLKEEENKKRRVVLSLDQELGDGASYHSNMSSSHASKSQQRTTTTTLPATHSPRNGHAPLTPFQEWKRAHMTAGIRSQQTALGAGLG